MTKLKNDINQSIVKEAINNTFAKRESLEYLNDYDEIINSIIDSEKIKTLWNLYSQKNIYAKNIEVDQIILLLRNFIKELNLDLITI